MAIARQAYLLVATDGALGTAHTVAGRATLVQLQRRLAVAAEVVDADGMPLADVEVALGRWSGGTFAPRLCGRTGRGGRVRLVLAAGDAAALANLSVRAAVVAPARVQAALPAGYFDRAPELLRLQLPPCGSLRVRVRGASARAVPRYFSLGLPDGEGNGSIFAAREAPDEVVFAHVALGLEGQCRFVLSGGEGINLQAPVRGPRRAGEAGTATVDLGSCVPVVEGRLLDADGRPLAGQQLQVLVERLRGCGTEHVRTDADGRFRFLPEDKLEKADDLRLTFRGGTASDGAPLAAFVHLQPGQRGMVDVGELRLQREPVLCSGRVVDGDGKAVAGVAVAVGTSSMPGNAAFSAWIRPPSPSGADGSFTVFEFEPVPAARALRIEATGWLLRHELEVQPGARDVRVVVDRTGHIEARLRGAAPAAALLSWEVRSANGVSRQYARPAGGALQFADLLPGRYELRAFLLGQELFCVPGLEVEAGAGCADPRLADLDWKAHVQLVAVRVFAADGTQLRGRLHLLDDRRAQHLDCDADGRAEVPWREGLRLAAGAPLHRTQLLQPAREPVEVRLQPCARLRLRLPEGLQLPDGVLVAFPRLPELRNLGRAVAEWRNGAEMVVRPDADGACSLQLLVRQGAQWIVIHEQDVQLPADDRLHDLLLAIDRHVVDDAASLLDRGRR